MHIVIAMPTPEYVHNEFALGNLPEIVNHTKSIYPDIKISVAHKHGVRTDSNRNQILQECMNSGDVDYILWLDVDMIYPKQIIERYLDTLKIDQTIDVIGCLYFKRAYPYDPIAYEKSNDPIKPYRTILPSTLNENVIYEVEAVGYGGMMVNMKVYEKLGEKKWTHYGSNFHIPLELEDKLTHDLQFCKDVKEAGMSIKLHGGVRPGHMVNHPVTIEDWRKATEEEFKFRHKLPSIQIIMPVTNVEQGKQAALLMEQRAGIPCNIAVVHDDARKGFIGVVNDLFKKSDAEVVGYTAQDVIVGEDWLLHAMMRMLTTNAGLLALNGGKFHGKLASYGLVQRSWVKDIYNGNLFFPGYSAHYADTELTQIAKQQGRFAYAEKSVMLEIDFDKFLGNGKKLNQKDKKLYKKRKKIGFDGKVTDKNLLLEFA